MESMLTKKNLEFCSIRILFYHEAVAVFVGARVGTAIEDFFMQVLCRHLDWQVYSMAQIFQYPQQIILLSDRAQSRLQGAYPIIRRTQ